MVVGTAVELDADNPVDGVDEFGQAEGCCCPFLELNVSLGDVSLSKGIHIQLQDLLC